MFLPSTFEGMHSGPAGTYAHSSVHASRYDYVAIPYMSTSQVMFSFVAKALEAVVVGHDRWPVVVSTERQSSSESFVKRKKHVRN